MSNIKFLNFLVLLISIIYTKSCYSKLIDEEIKNAYKCYSLFKFYERKYKLPKDVLFAISIKETRKTHSAHKKDMVWPWSINVEGRGYYFQNKKDAVNFVDSALKNGKTSIDVGCMQINLKHHPYAFSTIEQAIDPKSNINYAGYFLASKYLELNSWNLAIAHYHSATPQLGDKYYQDVVKIWLNIDKYREIFKPKYRKRLYKVY